MTILLGLDVGTKRTGAALADTNAGFVIALDTIHHASPEELGTCIAVLAREKHVSEIIIGLPRLPQGDEGKQALLVRELVTILTENLSQKITLIDERFTSHGATRGMDPDAKAACEMLSVVLDQRKKDY